MEEVKQFKEKQCRHCNYYHGDPTENGEGACWNGSVSGVYADNDACSDFSPKNYIYKKEEQWKKK